MAAPKKRRHTPPPKEEGDLKTGRFYCRKIEWWDNYSDEELELMQHRGKHSGKADMALWSGTT